MNTGKGKQLPGGLLLELLYLVLCVAVPWLNRLISLTVDIDSWVSVTATGYHSPNVERL